jgi:hypothetical protein
MDSTDIMAKYRDAVDKRDRATAQAALLKLEELWELPIPDVVWPDRPRQDSG